MKSLMKDIGKNFKKALLLTLVLMGLCGLAFPLITTGLAQTFFPAQAGGSLVEYEGKVVGARTVGQEFTEDYYLWSRPSAVGYNTYREENGKKILLNGEAFQGPASGSENYALSNPALKTRVEAYVDNFLKKNPGIQISDIPMDLVSSSGSGLDPHISVQGAEIQVPRIAKSSGLEEKEVREIIARHTEDRLLGIFGERTVNVLLLNIDLTKAMEEK